ncbi:protein FAR1-RELATED SEQUENCE 5-like [Spinacia oleracea]|uniref:Protein FAR1-RELATED SEQUENCE 5-like n=1 Tax=Spinacia oleracea TaxID=3562 RepID=A0ABM3RPR4_SPIOL|nr:protein FAR1-RELATED SEQUENCE 5-like [Spinacia oleracea]
MDNSWVVKNVVNEHLNPNPTPTKSTHISMFKVKKITDIILNQIVNDHESGAPVAQIFNNLAGRRNGVENIGFTKKDMHNFLNKRMRLRLRDGDAATMINYLDKMTKDNQIFFHLHRVDKTRRLQDVMWVDARSRAAYKYFGDVMGSGKINWVGGKFRFGCGILKHVKDLNPYSEPHTVNLSLVPAVVSSEHLWFPGEVSFDPYPFSTASLVP